MREPPKQSLLNTAFKTGDLEAINAAIRQTILGAGNVSAFALKAKVDRTIFYRLPKHDPKFDFVLKVLTAADFPLVIKDDPQPRSGRPSFASRNLSNALATENITLIVKAFSDALRAQENVALFASLANMHRETLYRGFKSPRIPRFSTVLGFLNAMGLRLAVSHQALNTVGCRKEP